ncbi:hypothetical protein BDZ45DRAFT_717385 [Acephala macrosclerotiorum]|nr:hypothetical protein BDZ45DRAFT_717385 [Acephala macrosclerotiorum]
MADREHAVAAAFAKGLSNSVIIFSEGVDYNIFAPISTKNLSNFAIQMQGNPHLPQNATAIQNLLNACNALTYSTALYWFTFASPSIDCVGPSNVSNSWINSYGQAWWDKNPVNGTGIANAPHLMSFNTTSGTNIKIYNSVIFNGDDVTAVQSGSHNVLFQGGTIGYQSHGMSISSLGQNQASFANVANIHFDDITVINAGLAKNITWSNFTWANFTGTINTFSPGDGSCASDLCWYNVGLPNLKHTEAVIVECNTNTSCQNFAVEMCSCSHKICARRQLFV